MTPTLPRVSIGLAALAATALAAVAPAQAQYRQKIGNDLGDCRPGDGSAVLVTVEGVKSSSGRVRVQAYRATKADWLQKGRWINRIEAPARAGTMTFCVPVPGPGSYGVAVRHNVSGDGSTNILRDGGGVSNNPPLSILRGKPSVDKATFAVGDGVKSIRVRVKYVGG